MYINVHKCSLLIISVVRNGLEAKKQPNTLSPRTYRLKDIQNLQASTY